VGIVHHTACPLCSSDNISPECSCTDHFVSREHFEVFHCGNCGFKFTQDYPDTNDIGKYYESEDYISHSNTENGFINKIYRIVRSRMMIRKRTIVRNASSIQKGNLLDIGCGTGHFANFMKQSVWDVSGIEINEKARSFATTQFGLNVIDPEMISALQKESFDCITLWHVMEHFHDPFKYFSEISRMLKPGGTCIVALPNSNSYDSKFYGAFWAAWDVPRHLWHFSPSTFKIFAEKGGFALITTKTLPLDVFYISMMSEKYKGSPISFIKGIAIGSVLAFLAAFNKRKSSSVIYILRK
jgi:ubiquinone/menaquinone biosynthesis C-methylase UbiE